ncbi:hypothetical protein AURANDRAFT_16376, partial [Aureococcus anophagefferens]
DFTPAQLRAFDGRDDDTPVYVALRGEVFDVSAARHFYGPGGGYEMFRGRDASRCLAKMSLEEADLDGPPEDVDRGWPDLDDLDAKDTKILDDWVALFKRKYPVVATL